MIEAVLANPEVTHLYLMSGQDYPLRSDEEIRQGIAGATRDKGEEGGTFLEIARMPFPDKPMTRIEKRFFRDNPAGVAIWLERAARILPRRKAEVLLRGRVPHADWQWWLLERRAA